MSKDQKQFLKVMGFLAYLMSGVYFSLGALVDNSVIDGIIALTLAAVLFVGVYLSLGEKKMVKKKK